MSHVEPFRLSDLPGVKEFFEKYKVTQKDKRAFSNAINTEAHRLRDEWADGKVPVNLNVDAMDEMTAEMLGVDVETLRSREFLEANTGLKLEEGADNYPVAYARALIEIRSLGLLHRFQMRSAMLAADPMASVQQIASAAREWKAFGMPGGRRNSKPTGSAEDFANQQREDRKRDRTVDP